MHTFNMHLTVVAGVNSGHWSRYEGPGMTTVWK